MAFGNIRQRLQQRSHKTHELWDIQELFTPLFQTYFRRILQHFQDPFQDPFHHFYSRLRTSSQDHISSRFRTHLDLIYYTIFTLFRHLLKTPKMAFGNIRQRLQQRSHKNARIMGYLGIILGLISDTFRTHFRALFPSLLVPFSSRFSTHFRTLFPADLGHI